jgi:hypothetical protein
MSESPFTWQNFISSCVSILLHGAIYECTSVVTSGPKSHPAPRGLTDHFSLISSGSDQTRSYIHTRSEYLNLFSIHWQKGAPQNGPSCGISWHLWRVRIWSRLRMSGESPPWTQSTDPSMICCWCIRILCWLLQVGEIPRQLWGSQRRSSSLSRHLHFHTLFDIHLLSNGDVNKFTFNKRAQVHRVP